MTRDSILAALNDPNRAWVVLIIGVVLIYRECVAPGRVFPGVLGAVAVALAIYSLVQKPLNTWAVLAVLGAIGLLVAQAFLRRFFWPSISVAAALLTWGVHSLTTPGIGFIPALAAIPLSGITGFLLRTAVLARRNKVSIE